MVGESRTHIKIEVGTTGVERFKLGWVWGDRREDVGGGISKTYGKPHGNLLLYKLI